MRIEDYIHALRHEVALIQAMLSKVDDYAVARPSPCEGWSVLDVGRHVEVTPRALASGIAAHLRGEAPPTSEALPTTSARHEVLSSLQTGSLRLRVALEQLQDEDLDGELPGPMGPMAGRRVLDLALTEIALHRCDIALGLGHPVEIDRAVAATLLDVVQAWLLRIAPQEPQPDDPLCYCLSDGSEEWWFQFDRKRGWRAEVCREGEWLVTARGRLGRLALGLAGRVPIEDAATDTSDVSALRMLKRYLPGP